MSEAVQIESVYRDGIVRISTLQNCVAAAWTDAPTVECLKVLAGVRRSLAERYPGVAFLNIPMRGTPKFSDDAREEASRQSRNPELKSLCTAHVVMASGLAGAATRTFMATVITMRRPLAPTKVFGNIGDASPWLLKMLDISGGPTWSPELLVALYEHATSD